MTEIIYTNERMIELIERVEQVFDDEDWLEWARCFKSGESRLSGDAIVAAGYASAVPLIDPTKADAARAAYCIAHCIAWSALYPDDADSLTRRTIMDVRTFVARAQRDGT